MKLCLIASLAYIKNDMLNLSLTSSKSCQNHNNDFRTSSIQISCVDLDLNRISPLAIKFWVLMLSSISNTKKIRKKLQIIFFFYSQDSRDSWLWNLEIREKKWRVDKGSHLWSIFRIRDFDSFIKDFELFHSSKFRDFYNSKKVSLPE